MTTATALYARVLLIGVEPVELPDAPANIIADTPFELRHALDIALFAQPGYYRQSGTPAHGFLRAVAYGC